MHKTTHSDLGESFMVYLWYISILWHKLTIPRERKEYEHDKNNENKINNLSYCAIVFCDEEFDKAILI